MDNETKSHIHTDRNYSISNWDILSRKFPNLCLLSPSEKLPKCNFKIFPGFCFMSEIPPVSYATNLKKKKKDIQNKKAVRVTILSPKILPLALERLCSFSLFLSQKIVQRYFSTYKMLFQRCIEYVKKWRRLSQGLFMLG